MTAPDQAAARLALGLLLGAGLGLLYGFLRPLRQKRTAPADLLFVLAAVLAWVYFSFGVCQGDIRLSGTATLGLGALAWELSAGRLLRPVFRLFWKGISSICRLITLPVRKIFQKIGGFFKKVFASVKKRGTIYWNSRRQNRRTSGGDRNEQADEISVQFKAGLPPRQMADQGGAAVRHRVVYGDAAGASPGHHRRRDPK